MRAMRTLLLFIPAMLAVAAGAPTVSATSTPHHLHLVKDCSTYTGETPTYCTITVSDLTLIPPGTKVWYKGPILTNSYFLSSEVTLDAGHGDAASGYCIFEAKTSVGLCTFWKGTGRLTGFTTVVDVTIDAAGLWNWDGEYYIADAAEAAAAAADDTSLVLASQDLRPW